MTKVYDLNGNVKKEMKLPKVFSVAYRPDVINRAILSIQSMKRQPYGANPLAGKRTSAHYHGRRKYRFTMMNKEMARISRIHGKVGYLNLRARFVPQAVKGRKAHPPKAERVWTQRINEKEKRLAIKSALAASTNQELVKERHNVDEAPLIFTNDFEDMKKTKEVKTLLDKIIYQEMKRCEKKKVRAGKGKNRGRKYKKKIGPLIIVSKDCNLLKSARSIAGIDVAKFDGLDAELLAPGCLARLTIMTESAIEKLNEKFGE
ncbi:MAG: 50S ribosomal protein L4 [Candidatus Aenigmatarchaeota archaeon]